MASPRFARFGFRRVLDRRLAEPRRLRLVLEYGSFIEMFGTSTFALIVSSTDNLPGDPNHLALPGQGRIAPSVYWLGAGPEQ